jgi:hypothetical protein
MAELLACWAEADRADDIAAALHRIRSEVDTLLVNEVADVSRQIQLSAKLLRDFYDLFHIYTERGDYLLDYIDVVLPCFRRTLQDIWVHIGNFPVYTFERIWMDLDEHFQRQSDVPLRERFRLYNDFFVRLNWLLSRSEASFPVIGGSLTSQQTIDV